MALIFNSTTISPSYPVKFGSTALKSIKYGSTEVWKNSINLFNGSSFDPAMGGWSAGSVSGGVISRSFSTYIFDYGTNWVDLTGYNTLTFVINSYSTGTNRVRCVGAFTGVPGNGTTIPAQAAAYAQWSGGISSATTLTVNVSALTGGHLIGIWQGMGSSYSSTYKISSITLS